MTAADASALTLSFNDVSADHIIGSSLSSVSCLSFVIPVLISFGSVCLVVDCCSCCSFFDIFHSFKGIGFAFQNGRQNMQVVDGRWTGKLEVLLFRDVLHWELNKNTIDFSSCVCFTSRISYVVLYTHIASPVTNPGVS